MVLCVAEITDKIDNDTTTLFSMYPSAANRYLLNDSNNSIIELSEEITEKEVEVI